MTRCLLTQTFCGLSFIPADAYSLITRHTQYGNIFKFTPVCIQSINFHVRERYDIINLLFQTDLDQPVHIARFLVHTRNIIKHLYIAGIHNPFLWKNIRTDHIVSVSM